MGFGDARMLMRLLHGFVSASDFEFSVGKIYSINRLGTPQNTRTRHTTQCAMRNTTDTRTRGAARITQRTAHCTRRTTRSTHTHTHTAWSATRAQHAHNIHSQHTTQHTTHNTQHTTAPGGRTGGRVRGRGAVHTHTHAHRHTHSGCTHTTQTA